MAGRGFGKTRSGAEWVAAQAKQRPGSEWAVVAPTYADIKETCFEGKSGLLRALGMRREDPRYNKTDLLLRLGNGSIVKSFSAEEPARVHGPNLTGAWCDEIAKWKSRDMWDSLAFAIRDGDAQTVASTTPLAVPLVQDFAGRTDGSVVVTRGSTFTNERNLSPAFIAEMRVRYAGTRRERQELYGELLEDVPGALWSAALIERTRAVLLD
jgi:phage terminase large subunit-like protein